MLRFKSNKQAFIAAALVVLLCLVLLSGATYALFTNDPNDGTIGVVTTSGNIEIDIVDTAGDSLQTKALAFLIPQGYVSSESVLFEPGATFFTQEFQVKNRGDIPVNFTLGVSKDETIDMKEFEEAFEVWIVKGKDFENAEHLQSFKEVGLAPGGESENYCLCIRMKETAGNEFQNKEYTGIGVTVYAVQGNVYEY